jgi:predicted phosphoribosyltransferase
VRVLNDDVCAVIRCPPEIVDAVAAREGVELARRELAYRGARPPIDVRDKTAVLVDDGIATGASIRAAVKAVRALGAKRVVVATPIAPMETCRDLRVEADEVVCVRTPEPFGAVGRWYRDFDETTDAEVRSLLGLGELEVRS